MSNILEIKKIKQYFYQGKNKILVLNEIDLKIEKSKKIAIVGASGSGKSSLLNIASLMEMPKGGEVFVMGKSTFGINDNQKSDIRKKNIGYIHQKNALLMEFSALENIYIALLINNYNKKYAKEKSYELLKLVNMTHRANHKPSSLSGGEQQRVAIARAICNNPELIIADEPTGNLDSLNSNKIIEELIKISKDNRTSLLLATHDNLIANKMDEVYQLTDGVLNRK